MNPELELVERVRKGDQAALRELVDLAKSLVFNLAIRMLGSPADAEDATQEILIRVVTGLESFRGESALKTWIYRVASNHLLNAKKRRVEELFEKTESLEQNLDAGMVDPAPAVDDQILVTEAKLHCTSHMMLGLDRDHRLAFVLGEILELAAEEGAAVLEISPDAFRKRLSRARQRMAELTSSRCGLVDPSKPCRCGKQMGRALRVGLFDPKTRPFTSITQRQRAPTAPHVAALDGLSHALSVFRSHPDYTAPETTTTALRKLLTASPFAG